MSAGEARPLDERVLILAPTGRDAIVIRDVLARAGIAAEPCLDMHEVCIKLEEGTGALLLAEEALTLSALTTLTRTLRAQPPWSDVPIIVSTGQGETTEARVRAISSLEPSGNVIVLDRPVRVFTVVTTVQAALRARRRQYEMRDLHQRLQAQMEHLQTERELRARFVSLLAHDLRGPVSTATLASDLLIRNPEKLDRRRELAVRIKRSMERLDGMVRDLLDASRVQAGEPLPLRLDACELRMIASEVVEELSHLHPDRLRLDGREEVEGVWSAAELRRAIWNLATNAIKYGAPATPVTLTVRRVDGRARVSVHNEGRPLSPEDQQRIFEPFARVRSPETASQVGWGLGLTLVRGCVEAHGGQIQLVSSVEAGTTFTIDIPLDARAAQAESSAKPQPVIATGPRP